MKKKIFAVLACMLTLLLLCTMFAFAEESGTDGSEAVWDFWSLLNPENVNYLQVISILITTLVTMIRMVSGGGLKELWELLVNAVKNLLAGK